MFTCTNRGIPKQYTHVAQTVDIKGTNDPIHNDLPNNKSVLKQIIQMQNIKQSDPSLLQEIQDDGSEEADPPATLFAHLQPQFQLHQANHILPQPRQPDQYEVSQDLLRPIYSPNRRITIQVGEKGETDGRNIIQMQRNTTLQEEHQDFEDFMNYAPVIALQKELVKSEFEIDGEEGAACEESFENSEESVDKGSEPSTGNIDLTQEHKHTEKQVTFENIYHQYPSLEMPKNMEEEDLLEMNTVVKNTRTSIDELKPIDTRISLPISFEIKEDKYQEQEEKQVNPFEIKIINYSSEYFLKIETQIYNIKVKTLTGKYTIRRRYSDFLLLHQVITEKYLGSILYPFPPKDIQTFFQVKIPYGSKAVKYEVIEHRLRELQAYLKCITGHCTLKDCEELKIFLESDQICSYIFTMKKLEEIYEECRLDLGSSYGEIKSSIFKGISYFKSLIVKNDSEERRNQERQKIAEMKSHHSQDSDYATMRGIADTLLQENEMLLVRLNDLRQIYTERVAFTDISTDIDLLLQLSAKTSSSKNCSRDFEQFIQIELLENHIVMIAQLKEILNNFQRRNALLRALDCDDIGRCIQIGRAIERFDDNLKRDWRKFREVQAVLGNRLKAELTEKWKDYCGKMKKIWK